MSESSNVIQSAPALDEEAGKRIVEQAFELWINPELSRREALGELSLPVELYLAQIVWPPEGDLQVRINEEVRGYAFTKLDRPVEKGDPILISDLTGFQGFELEDDELDYGHMTLIQNGKGWSVSFNFLRKRARGLALIAKSVEFFEAARLALARGHHAVVIDNLFSACELVSKADLISHHIIDEKSNHKAIHSTLNQQRRLGNVDASFVDLFNSLSRLRPFYRYSSVTSDVSPVSEDDMSLVEAMIERAKSKLARMSKEALESERTMNAIRIGL